MRIEGINKVCFVGAGTMGCFNSLVSAIAGYDAYLYDLYEEALNASEERQREWGAVLVEMGFASEVAVQEGLARITRTSDATVAAVNADLLSESVFEQLELKRETHRKFEKLLPRHAIMTTNTSSILLSDIEPVVDHGDRFAAMHFHQPTRLVDLVAGPRTRPETIDTLSRFVRSQNQVQIVLKKENPGYIHNNLYGSLLETSLLLLHIQAGTVEEIDRAWMLNQRSYGENASALGERGNGPFGLIDFVGLDVVHDVTVAAVEKAQQGGEALHEQKMAITTAIITTLRDMMNQGELGMKAGKGFYSYPDPEFWQPEFLEGATENKTLSDPIINGILKQAILLVADGVCDVEDVDLSWMLTHSPTIGPFGIMDDRGIDLVTGQLKDQAVFLTAVFGEDDPDLDELKRATDYLDALIDKGILGKKSGRGFYEYPDPVYTKPDFLL